MVRAMRRFGLVALVGMAVGCGRSGLTDEFWLPTLDDASVGADDGIPGTDASPPASDSPSVSPEDATVPPPPDDATLPPPPADDAIPPPPPPPPPDDGSTGCGPSTCQGCCQPDGTCLTQMSTPGPCGAHGEQCVFCDQTCLQGACGNPVSNCGPGTCGGCCAGSTICADGKHDTACGHGGAQCESCNPTTGGGQCILQSSGSGGQCQFATSMCNSNSCPQGCCVGNVCAQGTQDMACGTGGSVCTDCTANGTTCLVKRCAGGFPAH
jgi:hypothetical protein